MYIYELCSYVVQKILHHGLILNIIRCIKYIHQFISVFSVSYGTHLIVQGYLYIILRYREKQIEENPNYC